jgi:hypothetical protein
MIRRVHTSRAIGLLALVCGLATGCSRSAPPVTGPPEVVPKVVVSGEVRDLAGALIEGAIVTLTDLHNVPAPAASRGATPAAVQHGVLLITTEADGRFLFEPIPAGEYIVRGTKTGFLPTLVEVTLVGDGEFNSIDTTVVDLPLTPL